MDPYTHNNLQQPLFYQRSLTFRRRTFSSTLTMTPLRKCHLDA